MAPMSPDKALRQASKRLRLLPVVDPARHGVIDNKAGRPIHENQKSAKFIAGRLFPVSENPCPLPFQCTLQFGFNPFLRTGWIKAYFSPLNWEDSKIQR